MIGLNEEFSEHSDAKTPLADLHQITADLFASDGILKSAMGLESREAQEIMAKSVIDSWITDSPLLFEAETGVGRSLAY